MTALDKNLLTRIHQSDSVINTLVLDSINDEKCKSLEVALTGNQRISMLNIGYFDISTEGKLTLRNIEAILQKNKKVKPPPITNNHALPLSQLLMEFSETETVEHIHEILASFELIENQEKLIQQAQQFIDILLNGMEISHYILTLVGHWALYQLPKSMSQLAQKLYVRALVKETHKASLSEAMDCLKTDLEYGDYYLLRNLSACCLANDMPAAKPLWELAIARNKQDPEGWILGADIELIQYYSKHRSTGRGLHYCKLALQFLKKALTARQQWDKQVSLKMKETQLGIIAKLLWNPVANLEIVQSKIDYLSGYIQAQRQINQYGNILYRENYSQSNLSLIAGGCCGGCSGGCSSSSSAASSMDANSNCLIANQGASIWVLLDKQVNSLGLRVRRF